MEQPRVPEAGAEPGRLPGPASGAGGRHLSLSGREAVRCDGAGASPPAHWGDANDSAELDGAAFQAGGGDGCRLAGRAG